MPVRTLQRTVGVTMQRHSDALSTLDLSEQVLGAPLDPFVIVSLYHMAGPMFPPHPHAGFTVATYILPESPLGFVNQDSLGNLNRIAPGALHATIAGKGVLHEEQPETGEGTARDYQIWIDHADEDREVPPRAEHLFAGQVPIVTDGGATVRVVAGHWGGHSSPLKLPTPVTILDVMVAAGGRFAAEVPASENAFVVLLEGNVRCGETLLREGQVASFASDGDRIILDSGARGARFTLFAGRPLGHRKLLAGSFVATDAAQAARFADAYRGGRFGTLVPFAVSGDRLRNLTGG